MKVRANTNINKSVSFKGIYNNKFLLKTLKFAANNGSLFTASASLVLSTIARPVSIMATPKTDKENKKHACAKSIASSITGYLIMLVASMPVANAIKKMDKTPSKYLKQSTIKVLGENSKQLIKSKKYMFATQLFKLGLGFFIAIPKSALTCTLIPVIMKLFKTQNSSKEERKKQNSKIISFKGLYNTATENLAKGFGKIIDTRFIQNLAKKFYNTNFAQHIMSATDILLTLSFVRQTAKNKNIQQNRKKPLIYNSLISTGLCLTGGYALNYALNKPTEKFLKNFCKANHNLPDLEKYVEGIKIAKPALILGGIYYIIIPLIATFFAERIDKR